MPFEIKVFKFFTLAYPLTDAEVIEKEYLSTQGLENWLQRVSRINDLIALAITEKQDPLRQLHLKYAKTAMRGFDESEDAFLVIILLTSRSHSYISISLEVKAYMPRSILIFSILAVLRMIFFLNRKAHLN